ncbi:hypothetical protein VNO78_08922 [Psophocarpus tetragonolobus]|uniref:Uncharacterized protein n=1 Tax=Psophocarpus tetragonolobus TaxID=3891 RepID=A0AAN9SWL9_PSOTE
MYLIHRVDPGEIRPASCGEHHLCPGEKKGEKSLPNPISKQGTQPRHVKTINSPSFFHSRTKPNLIVSAYVSEAHGSTLCFYSLRPPLPSPGLQ